MASETAAAKLEGVECPEVQPDFEEIYASQKALMLTKKVLAGGEEVSVSLSDPMSCYCNELTAGG